MNRSLFHLLLLNKPALRQLGTLRATLLHTFPLTILALIMPSQLLILPANFCPRIYSSGQFALHTVVLLAAELAAQTANATLAADALIVSALLAHVDQLRALSVSSGALRGETTLADRFVIGADIHHA